jgi:hypothetical protein
VNLRRCNSQKRGLAGTVWANDYPALIGFNLPVEVVQNWSLIANDGYII